jgi:hypothetical protein
MISHINNDLMTLNFQLRSVKHPVRAGRQPALPGQEAAPWL